ncbi:MAG: 2-oxoacid:acceptor oxidoreductase family protein [Promethearchaeota archaeon]
MPHASFSPDKDMPRNRPFNMIIAGVGGQGILRAARLVSGAAHCQGLSVTIGETFGASRRGGTVLSHIRLASLQSISTNIGNMIPSGALVPLNMADVIIGLEPLETLRAAKYLHQKTRVVLNTHQQLPIDVLADKTTSPQISVIKNRLASLCSYLWSANAVELAQQAGDKRTANTVMIGVLAGLEITPIKHESFLEAIKGQFLEPSIQSTNEKAFRLGIKYGRSL